MSNKKENLLLQEKVQRQQVENRRLADENSAKELMAIEG